LLQKNDLEQVKIWQNKSLETSEAQELFNGPESLSKILIQKV
jgi:hypothetical protein